MVSRMGHPPLPHPLIALQFYCLLLVVGLTLVFSAPTIPGAKEMHLKEGPSGATFAEKQQQQIAGKFAAKEALDEYRVVRDKAKEKLIASRKGTTEHVPGLPSAAHEGPNLRSRELSGLHISELLKKIFPDKRICAKHVTQQYHSLNEETPSRASLISSLPDHHEQLRAKTDPLGTGTDRLGLLPDTDPLTDFVKTVNEAEHDLVVSYQSKLDRLKQALALGPEERSRFAPQSEQHGPAQEMHAQVAVAAHQAPASVPAVASQAMSLPKHRPFVDIAPSSQGSQLPAEPAITAKAIPHSQPLHIPVAANAQPVQNAAKSNAVQESTHADGGLKSTRQISVNQQDGSELPHPQPAHVALNSQWDPAPAQGEVPAKYKQPAKSQVPVTSELPTKSQVPADEQPLKQSAEYPAPSHVKPKKSNTGEVSAPKRTMVPGELNEFIRKLTEENRALAASIKLNVARLRQTMDMLEETATLHPADTAGQPADMPSRHNQEFERYVHDIVQQDEDLLENFRTRLHAVRDALAMKEKQQKSRGFGDFVPLEDMPAHHSQQQWGSAPVADSELGIVENKRCFGENCSRDVQRPVSAIGRRVGSEMLTEEHANPQLRDLLQRLRQEMRRVKDRSLPEVQLESLPKHKRSSD